MADVTQIINVARLWYIGATQGQTENSCNFLLCTTPVSNLDNPSLTCCALLVPATLTNWFILQSRLDMDMYHLPGKYHLEMGL